ncbi:ATP-binding protein [Lujinxingia sediminis]|nr:ATP-binding protein [Lujinxingia sediminis]
MSYEEGYENLRKLKSLYESTESHRNEATTRLHLIDQLFFNCLGWERSETNAEEHDNGEYVDYMFYITNRVLVVEAKKEGISFEVPAGNRTRIRKISTICRGNAGLQSAIQQALRYAQQCGVLFAAVANGHQIIAFLATRTDGVSPMEGQALVFESFDVMEADFLILWNALSRSAVSKRNLKYQLLQTPYKEPPTKLAQKIPDYPGVISRNIYQAEMKNLAEMVFEDIPKDSRFEAEFLDECYCEIGALSQSSLLGKAVLNTRYAAVFDTSTPGPAITPANTKNGISEELKNPSASNRPILILGEVGVGKTTFLRRLVLEQKSESEDLVSLFVNLGYEANLTDNLRSYLLREICSQIKRKYQINIYSNKFVRHLYRDELRELEDGIHGDLKQINPEKYLEKEIELLESLQRISDSHLKRAIEELARSHRKRLLLFLDNADQRDLHTQQLVFLAAQEFSQWPVTVFVSLRPSTYYESLRNGALSGYHPKAFTISPARTDEVIKKRLNLARKILAGDSSVALTSPNIERMVPELSLIVRSFQNSFTKRGEIAEFVDNVAAGNLRQALDFVRDSFGSAHVNTKKMVEIYRKSGRYTVPLHELIRSVMFGDTMYFSPKTSPICNLFDVTSCNEREHFLLPLLMQLLLDKANVGQSDGFVEAPKVVAQLQSFGFIPEQIDDAILRATNHRLVTTSGGRRPSQSNQYQVQLRITTAGAYHILRLTRMFTYIDAVVVDTPIFDESLHARIRDEWTIRGRIKRAEEFVNYLDIAWERSSFGTQPLGWESISSSLKEDINRIKTAIDRPVSR